MATGKRTRFDEELGKALCDRLGLSHRTTLADWSAETSGKRVWVTMTTMKAIPVDEYDVLVRVATSRAKEPPNV